MTARIFVYAYSHRHLVILAALLIVLASTCQDRFAPDPFGRL